MLGPNKLPIPSHAVSLREFGEGKPQGTGQSFGHARLHRTLSPLEQPVDDPARNPRSFRKSRLGQLLRFDSTPKFARVDVHDSLVSYSPIVRMKDNHLKIRCQVDLCRNQKNLNAMIWTR
jgi:hypothetical protein